jgi:hypothetical protein
VRRQGAAATALSDFVGVEVTRLKLTEDLETPHVVSYGRKSGVALRFPPQSKTPGGMPRAFKRSNSRHPWLTPFVFLAFFVVNASPRPLTRPAPVVTVYASFLRWNTKTH